MEDLTIIKDVEFLEKEVLNLSQRLMDLHDRTSGLFRRKDHPYNWFRKELEEIIGTSPMFTCDQCYCPSYATRNGSCVRCVEDYLL